jgi:diguanylate cyclase (GGDEF)-like protein/PAS domain S-box-containing protein
VAGTLHGSVDAPSAFEALLEFMYLAPVGIIKFRPDGRINMVNATAAQLLMPLSRQADMSDLFELLADLAPDLRRRVERFRAPVGQICDQRQLPLPGACTVLTLSINKVDPDTLMAVVQDITHAVELERRVRDDRQRFHAIFENVRDYAIFTVDIAGQVDEWNRSLQRLGGWEAADVAGASVDVFFPAAPSGRACGTDLLARARQSGTSEFEGWGVRRDGSLFWGTTVATALPNREGAASGYVLVTRDLTERKQMEDRLVALATTDPLTGAGNRRYGESELREAFRRWQRHGQRFAVALVDCDHFKAVNDTWGHDVGDKVLNAIVRICAENRREADIIVRWGGEEFLLLLPASGREVALAVAERLRGAIGAATLLSGGDSIKVTVSIGVAEVCGADAGPDDVVRRVDRALYRAKGDGRNRVIAN